MPKSIFIPFRLEFNNSDRDDTTKQAQVILDKIDELLNIGYTQVGITYSANAKQSQDIRTCYERGRNITGTSGSNQAAVVQEVERLLQTTYQRLLGKFRIIPICTMTYSGTFNNSDLQTDLIGAKSFLEKEGHVLLGWQNQYTGDNYAIGGGVNRSLPINQKVTPSQEKEIQDTLKDLARIYPTSIGLSRVPAKRDVVHPDTREQEIGPSSSLLGKEEKRPKCPCGCTTM